MIKHNFLKKYRILILCLIFIVVGITGCREKANENQTITDEVSNKDSSKDTQDNSTGTNGVQEEKNNESETEDSDDINNTSKNTEERPTIKIMYSAGLCGIPLHIAKQLNFYEAEGLVEGIDYEYVTSSTTGVEMLTSGQADITFGLIAAMLAPLDNGLEAKTVLGIHTGCIQILAGKDTGITNIAGLKGKKIGVSQLASSAHIVAQRALADAGIGSTADNMEVEFVVFAADDLPLALKNGAVDAIAIGDPKATILMNDGDAVPLFNSATSDLLKDEYCCSLWVRNETLDKYPEQVAAIVRAIQKSSAWVDQNVDLAAEIQLDNDWLVGDLAIDQQILKSYKYLPSVSGVKEALTRNIFDMKELGLIKEDTDAKDLAKNGFFLLDGVPDNIADTVEAPIDPTTQLKKEK